MPSASPELLGASPVVFPYPQPSWESQAGYVPDSAAALQYAARKLPITRHRALVCLPSSETSSPERVAQRANVDF